MARTSRIVALGALVTTLSLQSMLSALAASGETASGTPLSSITVEQRMQAGAQGKWTMIKPDQTSTRFADPAKTLKDMLPGTYTIFAELPAGTTASIVVYRGTTIVTTAEQPQISFTLAGGESLRIVITYRLSIVGTITINSDPLGIPYEITGPNAFTASGTAPGSYENVAIGQYKVQFRPLGCTLPRPQSQHLEKDGRLKFSIILDRSCAAAEAEQRSVDFSNMVSITVHGKSIYLTDVPQDAWFAQAVLKVATRGIITGYRDSAGEPTGAFGPGNPVTVAELLKIAHHLAGIPDESLPQTADSSAPWYVPFMQSATDRDWLITLNTTLDPVRPATRGEVVATLLQALDVPVRWPTGKLFTDVKRRTPYAGPIETMAGARIIAGHSDEKGNPTGLFGPEEPINRAEMAKVVSLAIGMYKGDATKSE